MNIWREVWLCMSLFFRVVLLVLVCVCSVILGGCSFVWTTENGDPATPEDIKASAEKEFSVVHPRLVLQSAVVEKEKPFQRNVYVFYDESNGFSFTINSVVHSPTLPAPGGERDNDADFAYSQAYLVHLNSSLVESAKQYGIRMATHEEALELAKSKATRVAGTNKIPLFTYDEIVFVDKSVKGEDILTFMKSIYSLYKPQDNPALLPTERSIGFYYLPKGEEDTTKAKYMISFRFKARNDWKETMLTGIGSTGNDVTAVERNFVEVLDDMILHAKH